MSERNIVTPLRDNVIVAPIEPENKTSSGIVLMGDGNTDTRTAKVVATGPDTNYVKQDNIVFIDWPKSKKITGFNLYVLREEDIMIVVE